MTARVLIVDDVEETRSALAELLEASGDYEVVGEAEDGIVGVELAAQHTPDLVLMDIRMPRMDGIEATRAIVSASPHSIVIAHTAYQDISLVRDMIGAGAKGYVLKGSGADRLLATMNAALEGHAILPPEVTRILLDELQQLYSHEVTRTEHLEEKVEEFQDAATHDHLTGLWNHRAFHEQLEGAARAAADSGDALTVAILDLDDFKLVNDLFGHATGDRLIAEVASVVASTVEGAGSAYRIGGDELAVILPGSNVKAARERLEHLRTLVSSMQFGSHRNQTISVGIASYPDAGPNKDFLVAAADEAMYDAKSRGKDNVQVFGERPGLSGYSQGADTPDARAAIITALAALGVRDRHTLEHCERVSALSAAIATELGLTPAEIETVRIGGLLHDVGKIGVPDAVLHATAPLPAPDQAAFRRHPDHGRAILGRVLPRAIIDCIAHHHEQPDGNGFPLGLSAMQIPLSAAIVHVADAFDQLTRSADDEAQTPAGAFDLLGGLAGTEFDADAVEALRRVELGNARIAA
jgi:diguanylate cyclase (GGDEF)-like protein/putative nucleotidyltransferase with HDIG domain